MSAKTKAKAKAFLDKQKKLAAQKVEESAAMEALKRENRRLRKKMSSVGATGDLIVNAVEECFVKDPNFRIQKPAKSRAKTLKEEIAILHISDTQIGKTTSTYDSQIAEERLLELTRNTIKICRHRRKAAKVNRIHVYLGGDMVEGEQIFPHQPHKIDSSVFDQACHTTPTVLSSVILSLAQEIPEVHVVAVPGNHGRPASKHAGSHPKTNWDSVCYLITKLMVEPYADNVTWNIPEKWWAVDELFGGKYRNLVVHGDQIIGSGGVFPINNTAKKLAGWADSMPVQWESLYFGHFHTYASGFHNSKKWFCNGTTESDNDFARRALAACGDPIQRLQFWNEELGFVVDYPVYLKHGITKKRRS